MLAGFKLNGDGDHEVGNLRKYHVKLNPSVSLVYSVFGYLTLRRERCG
jgi:hypothetical protein